MANENKNTKQSSDNERSVIATVVLSSLAVIGILLLLFLLIKLKSLVVLGIISIVFATGLAPSVVRFEKARLPGNRHLPRGLAIFIVYILAVIIALGAITLIVVPVVQEIIRFKEHWPQYLGNFENWLGDMHNKYPQVPDYANLLKKAQSQVSSLGSRVVGSVGAVFGFFGGFVSVFTVLVLTFYMLLDFERIKKGFIALLPHKHQKKTENTLSKIAATMGGWLRAQLLLAGIIGVVVSVMMVIMGVPYPYVIGVVGAIGELVPMLGPIAAAVPALILSIGSPLWHNIVLVVFFIILVIIESNVLAPKIMQKQVGLSPIITIIALIAGTALLGIVGALLAVPVAAGLQVFFVEVIAPAMRNSGNSE